MGSNSHVALRSRYPQGRRFGDVPVLTNRMSQLLTYGSVGGVGRKSGPYPAANSRPALRLMIMDNLNIHFASVAPFPAVAELDRSA